MCRRGLRGPGVGVSVPGRCTASRKSETGEGKVEGAKEEFSR